MGEKQFRTVLKIAKDKYRKDRQTAIYAVTKGNVTQMLNETYNSPEELRRAINQYKTKGFYEVFSYLSI